MQSFFISCYKRHLIINFVNPHYNDLWKQLLLILLHLLNQIKLMQQKGLDILNLIEKNYHLEKE